MRRTRKKACLRTRPNVQRRPGRSHTRQRLDSAKLSDRAKRQILGQTIRKCREEAGHTQAALAELIGVGVSTVGGWERGSRRVYIHDVFDLCRALDREASEFVGLYTAALDQAQSRRSRPTT